MKSKMMVVRGVQPFRVQKQPAPCAASLTMTVPPLNGPATPGQYVLLQDKKDPGSGSYMGPSTLKQPVQSTLTYQTDTEVRVSTKLDKHKHQKATALLFKQTNRKKNGQMNTFDASFISSLPGGEKEYSFSQVIGQGSIVNNQTTLIDDLSCEVNQQAGNDATIQDTNRQQAALSIFDNQGREIQIKDRNSHRQHFETSADDIDPISQKVPLIIKPRQSISQGNAHQKTRSSTRNEGTYLRIQNPIIKGIGPEGLEVGSFFTRKSNNSSSLGGAKTKGSLGVESVTPGVLSTKAELNQRQYVALEPSLRNYPSQPVGQKPRTSSSVRHRTTVLQRGSPGGKATTIGQMHTSTNPTPTNTDVLQRPRTNKMFGASLNQTSQYTRGTVSSQYQSNAGRVTVDNIDLRMQKKNYHHKFYQILNNIPPKGGNVTVIKNEIRPRPPIAAAQQRLYDLVSEHRSSSAQQTNTQDYTNLTLARRLDFLNQQSPVNIQKQILCQNISNPFNQTVVPSPSRGRSVSPTAPPATIMLPRTETNEDAAYSTEVNSVRQTHASPSTRKKQPVIKSGTSSQMSPIRMDPVQNYNAIDVQFNQINEWTNTNRQEGDRAVNSSIQDQTDHFVQHVGSSIEQKSQVDTPILLTNMTQRNNQDEQEQEQRSSSNSNIIKEQGSVDLLEKNWNSPDNCVKEMTFLQQSVGSAGADLDHIQKANTTEYKKTSDIKVTQNNYTDIQKSTLQDEQESLLQGTKRIEERSILAEMEGSVSNSTAFAAHSAYTRKLPQSSNATVSGVVSKNSQARKPIRIGKVVALKTGLPLNNASDFDGERSHTPTSPKKFDADRTRPNIQGISQSIVTSGKGFLSQNFQPDIIKSGQNIAGKTQNIYMLLKDNDMDKESSIKELNNYHSGNGGTTTQHQHTASPTTQPNKKNKRGSRLNVDQNMLVKQVEFQKKPDNRKDKVHQSYMTKFQSRKRQHRKSMVIVNRDFSRPGEPSPNSKATLHGSSNTQIFNNKLIQNNTQNKLDLQSSNNRSSILQVTNVQDLLSQKTEHYNATFSPKSPISPTAMKQRHNRCPSSEDGNSRNSSAGQPMSGTCLRFFQREQSKTPGMGTLGMNTLLRPDSHNSNISPGRSKNLINQMLPMPVKISKKMPNHNEDMFPVMDQTYAENFQHPRLTKTLNLVPNQGAARLNEAFEEEVNGINLGKLFSIYGANSQQIAARQKQIQRKIQRGKDPKTPKQQHSVELNQFLQKARVPMLLTPGSHNQIQEFLGPDGALSKSSDLIPIFKRLAQGNVTVKANSPSAIHVPDLKGTYNPDLFKFEQNIQADQMQMLRNLFGDGSLNDLLFPNQAPNDRKFVNQSAPLMKQDSPQLTYGSETESENDNDEEANAQYIIQMLGAMMNKRKTVPECMAICQAVNLEKLQKEIYAARKRDMAAKSVAGTGVTEKSIHVSRIIRERQAILSQKVKENPVLDNPIKMAKSQQKKEEIQQKQDLVNPFFKALQQQKQDRDNQLALELYEHTNPENLPLPLPQSDSEESNPDIVTVNDSYIKEAPGDVFRHTQFVDEPMNIDLGVVDEQAQQQRIATPTGSQLGSIGISSDMRQNEELFASKHMQKQNDIFCFYPVKIDVPRSKLAKLGDFTLARREVTDDIQAFILQHWPILKRKKIAFKIALDAQAEQFNVIMVGTSKGKDTLGQVPLSLCCKMNVCFQFSRIFGGRVVCTESLCSHNPISSFFFDLQMQDRLFPNQAEDAFVKNYANWGFDVRPQAHIKILQGAQTVRSVKTGPFNLRTAKDKFNRAVSHEISRRVKTGSIKTTALDEVISGQEFQEEAIRPALHTSELMRMILGKHAKPMKRMSRKKQIELQETADQISKVLGIFPQKGHHFTQSEDYGVNKEFANRLRDGDSDSFAGTDRFTQMAAKGI